MGRGVGARRVEKNDGYGCARYRGTVVSLGGDHKEKLEDAKRW